MNLSAKTERLARIKSMAATGETRAIRLAARLSARDLSIAVGVDTSTIQRWESGTRTPRGDAAWRYAEVIGRLERQQAAP